MGEQLVFVIAIAGILLVIALGMSLTGSVTESVSVAVQARVTVLPAYNLSVDLKITKVVLAGDKLYFKVYLTKKDLTKMSKPIDVDLNYGIYKGNVLLKKGFLKTVTLTKQDTETFSLKVPPDYNTGNYRLNITATNPQSYTASDTEPFIVIKRFGWRF